MTQPKELSQRLNSALSALFKICVILFLLWTVCSLVWLIVSSVSSNIKHEEDTKVITSTTTLHIDTYEHISGTDVWRAPAYFDNNAPGMLSSAKTREVRNYVFFNVATKQAYWLKPQSDAVITQLSPYPDYTFHLDKGEIKFFIAQLSDEKVGKPDGGINVAIADPVGEHFTTILVGINAIQAVMDNGANEAIILYTKDGKLRYCSFDLKQWRVLNDLASNEIVISEKP